MLIMIFEQSPKDTDINSTPASTYDGQQEVNTKHTQ